MTPLREFTLTYHILLYLCVYLTTVSVGSLGNAGL